jgi:6-phosphogluconolactonase (cycloisomerase 2 family)
MLGETLGASCPPQNNNRSSCKHMSGNERFLSLTERLHSTINTFRLESVETHKILSIFRSNFKYGDTSPTQF